MWFRPTYIMLKYSLGVTNRNSTEPLLQEVVLPESSQKQQKRSCLMTATLNFCIGSTYLTFSLSWFKDDSMVILLYFFHVETIKRQRFDIGCNSVHNGIFLL